MFFPGSFGGFPVHQELSFHVFNVFPIEGFCQREENVFRDTEALCNEHSFCICSLKIFFAPLSLGKKKYLIQLDICTQAPRVSRCALITEEAAQIYSTGNRYISHLANTSHPTVLRKSGALPQAQTGAAVQGKGEDRPGHEDRQADRALRGALYALRCRKACAPCSLGSICEPAQTPAPSGA